MSEAERRHAFHSRRVLIETARVLSPQFDESLVCLSGAHLELLRNLTQYLDRPDTFVSEYADGYYLSPDDEDWNDIGAVVADLEERLMGCGMPAIPDKSAMEFETVVADGSPYVSLVWTAVPQDRMRVVDYWSAQCADNVCDAILFQVYDGSDWRTASVAAPIATGVIYTGAAPLTLEETQNLRVLYVNPAYSDTLNALMIAFDWKIE